MQKEPASRRRGSGSGTRTGREDIWNSFSFEMSSAHVDHRADQIAHHVMEESVAANAIDEEISVSGLLLYPGRGENRADG